MSGKRRTWLLIALGVVLCAAAAWGVYWYKGRALATPRGMLARLPAGDAVVVEIDFAGLRKSGILGMLAGSRAAEEPEYRDFVRRTGFDYASDLELALASFAPGATYFVLKGRFDWPRLRAYAADSGGGCEDGVCRMPGSAPGRNISYTLLRGNLLALAVSPDPGAATWLRSARSNVPPFEIPAEPVWIYLSPAAVSGSPALPSGTRMFTRGLEKAESCVLALGPEKQRFAATLRVKCRTQEDAAVLVESLGHTTELLRQMIARENHTPNPRDLSGVLTAGVFRQVGTRVYGYWPLERGFVEALLGAPGQ